jgi:hypothetical protein
MAFLPTTRCNRAATVLNIIEVLMPFMLGAGSLLTHKHSGVVSNKPIGYLSVKKMKRKNIQISSNKRQFQSPIFYN